MRNRSQTFFFLLTSPTPSLCRDHGSARYGTIFPCKYHFTLSPLTETDTGGQSNKSVAKQLLEEAAEAAENTLKAISSEFPVAS